jgi:hypothetical protein
LLKKKKKKRPTYIKETPGTNYTPVRALTKLENRKSANKKNVQELEEYTRRRVHMLLPARCRPTSEA